MEKASSSLSTAQISDTPAPKRTRWDATPLAGRNINQQIQKKQQVSYDKTPLRTGMTPSRFSQTPIRQAQTPKLQSWQQKTPQASSKAGYGGISQTPSHMKTPDILQNQSKLKELRWWQQIQKRNKPYTDEELDQLLPGIDDGYEVVKPPDNYKSGQTISSLAGLGLEDNIYQMPDGSQTFASTNLQPNQGDLPSIRLEEVKFFQSLLEDVNEQNLSIQEQKHRKIMGILLKIKNGTPQMRRTAQRQLYVNARQFGAGPLFNQILPLLMSNTLEDQERHILVKALDRILYKLDDQVRPYVHEILQVMEPMLVNEDYYARVQGRQVISNLAKAAGLQTMIKTMRADIDHKDQFVRNTTSKAFAVVASALGINTVFPFLKAVCNSKKSWQARHTGIKIIQQIAILMGCSILPYLKSLVQTVKNGLSDENRKVKIIAALAISALAEASAPYGIESFDVVLIPLYEGIKLHRDKSLGAFLKAIGFIIPLMSPKHAFVYTQNIMPILVKQFGNRQQQMRKIILKVLTQTLSSQGVQASFIRQIVVPEYFQHFWITEMASQKRNYKQLIQTTVELAKKVGGAEVISKTIFALKHDNQSFRKLAMQAIQQILEQCGSSDVDHALETQLMDSVLRAMHDQTTQDNIILNGFGAVVNALGIRAKPYFAQIIGTIQWRLTSKSIRIRQQAADLVSRISHCMKICGEQTRLGKLGLNLNECLRQEYPEVLGSILGALKAIVLEVGMNKMTPPIKDLLPRLTPILKNRHEKVQQNCIALVGQIADKGSEQVSPKQWMRVCFDLLQLLKAHRKSIRRAAVVTFGYIAKAIGPQDVLVTLLNNLKVQQRQLRICTTVAIAIVSESCGPFTTLPALMNEYRVQQLNVQNGVLKSLTFMFEYIGQMAKDYIYAVTPLLQDALTDKDIVHRQTATAAIKHLALSVQGYGCQDALLHLFNYIWPNIFQNSPHILNCIVEAVQALRLSLGPGIILQYLIQGLWHPARRVRQIYWRIYNTLYVSNQDGMVPFHPLIPKDNHHRYNMMELQTFI